MGWTQDQSTLEITDGLGQKLTARVTRGFAGDYSPGAAGGLTYTLTNTSTTLNNPNIVTLTLRHADGTTLRTIDLSSTPSGTALDTFMNSTGASGGSARSGTIEVLLRMRYTLGAGGIGNYDVTTDGSTTTVPAGSTLSTVDRGWSRSTTTVTQVVAKTAGGAKPTRFAYGSSVVVRSTLGTPPFITSETINTTLNGQTVSGLPTSGGVRDATMTSVGNNYPAASSTRTTGISFQNSVLGNGAAWTVSTSTTTDTGTFDPRLTFTHLHQDNDNTFGTPPTAKEAGLQRLTSALAFLDARVTDADGNGVNSITWNTVLQDAGALVTALTRSTSSTTQGGQVGWGTNFLVWDSALPGGTWNKTCTITAPSNATGLEASNTIAYSLVASDPNLRLVGAFGPTPTDEGTHFSPGEAVGAGFSVFKTDTQVMLTADSDTPKVAIGRQDPSTGRVQYLAADFSWQFADSGTIYFHTMAETFAGSKLYVIQFAGSTTATWGYGDLVAVMKCAVGGVPLSLTAPMENVSTKNRHDRYAFDGPGFVGFPTR